MPAAGTKMTLRCFLWRLLPTESGILKIENLDTSWPKLRCVKLLRCIDSYLESTPRAGDTLGQSDWRSVISI